MLSIAQRLHKLSAYSRLAAFVRSTVAALLTAAAIFPCGAAAAGPATARVDAGTTEAVSGTYVGTRDYLDVLYNIDFVDAGDSWARDAIYETGALGIVKGFGSATYDGGFVMTKGQAVALALRAAGQEAAAQLAGEALEQADRQLGLPPSDADTVWVDGCLSVAASLGMISQNDLAAGLGDPAGLALSGFRRGDAATRQEFVYWLSIALGIPPVRGQQSLFTNHADWRAADSLYAPYLEAALQEHIISGDAAGRLSPTVALTRDQAAQMVKNASAYVFGRNGFVGHEGTVERIVTDEAASLDEGRAELYRIVYYVRNSLGLLDTITVQTTATDGAGAASADRRDTGLVVNDGGTLEDDTALQTGDRIRYITARNPMAGYPDVVRYVETLENAAARSYVLAQIDAIDALNHRIAFTQVYPVEYPVARELKRAAHAAPELTRRSAEYVYSNDLAVRMGGRPADIGELSPGTVVIFGVENFRTVFWIETVGFGFNLGELGVARGIVEENSPVLGYVSMYIDPVTPAGDGTRTLGQNGERPELVVFNYTDAAGLSVLKDGAPATIDAVTAGDSAFVRYDEFGELTAISAVTNLRRRYGQIVSVSGNSMIVNFDGGGAAWSDIGTGGGAAGGGSGTPENLELPADVLYFQDFKLTGKAALVPGASIRVLLQDLGGSSVVREITVMRAGERGEVGSVYKATLSRIDELSQKAIVYNVQRLTKGAWEKVDRKGFESIPISGSTRIYLGETGMTPARANKLVRDCEVYIAAKNDYGGTEVAEQISVRGVDDKEQLYDDVIRSVRRPADTFGLAKGPSDIVAGAWTIVIRDGLLVAGGGIEQDDQVYVVASREDATGRLRAEIVEIGDRVAGAAYHIYRGRVSSVTRDERLTLESFSELELGEGTEWRYANTPKTLTISFDTLLLTADGIAPIREFDGRGAFDYTEPPRTVYVLSDGAEALAISTAPYGIENIRGTVAALGGQSADDDGGMFGEPTDITLSDVSFYDRTKYAWTARKPDTVVTLAPNTLVIKNGEAVLASELERSDSVRVIKSDTASTGVGYIVIVEG